MSLYPLAGQPVNLLRDPEVDNCSDCDDSQTPCVGYGPNDPLYLQLYNQPQSVQALPNPCDSPTGAFTSNLCATDWTAGGDWTIAGTFPSCTLEKTSSGVVSVATLALGTFNPSAVVYRFSFTLADVIGGAVRLRIGATTSPAFGTSGSHTWTVQVPAADALNPLEVEASADFIGVVNYLAGDRMDLRWDYTADLWAFDPELCAWQHVVDPSPNTDQLSFAFPLALDVYKLTVTVVDMVNSPAYLNIIFGTNTYQITAPGTYVYYEQITSSAGVRFLPSDNFDGAVRINSLEVSARRHQAFFFENGSNNTGTLPEPYYLDDYVTWTLLEGWQEQGQTAGCYNIGVLDERLDPSPQYILNPNFGPTTGWSITTLGGAAAYEGAAWWSSLECFDFEGTIAQTPPGLLTLPNCYRLHLEIVPVVTLGVPVPVDYDFVLNVGPTSLPFSGSGAFAVDLDVTLELGDAVSLNVNSGTFAIRELTLHRCYQQTTSLQVNHFSTCLAFHAVTDCDSRYLRGYVPYAQAPQNRTVALGFQFSPVFALAFRANAYFLNPTHETEDDRYSYRGGRLQRTASEVARRWELVVANLSEGTHEALAVATRCPVLEIGTSPSNLVEYVVTSDDYAPNWPKGYRVHAADVTLDVARLQNDRRYLRAIF